MSDPYQEAFDDVLKGEPVRWATERQYWQLRKLIVGTKTGRFTLGQAAIPANMLTNIPTIDPMYRSRRISPRRMVTFDMAKVEQRVVAQLAEIVP